MLTARGQKEVQVVKFQGIKRGKQEYIFIIYSILILFFTTEYVDKCISR